MKKIKQNEFYKYMGAKCTFTKYLERMRYDIQKGTKIKWEQVNFERSGWITGFGFVFNGTIKKAPFEEGNYTYFEYKNRIDFVKVKITPTGKEYKIPFKYVKVF